MDRRMTGGTIAAAALLACTFLAAGCDSGGDSGNTGTVQLVGFKPGIYVGTDYNSASMLNISRGPDGTLTGTMNELTEGESPGALAMTVVVSGTEITLNLKGALASETALTGTIKGDQLHIQVPQPDGTIEDYVFGPGTVDEYNSDVAALTSN